MRKFFSFIALLTAAVILCIGNCGASSARTKITILVSYNGAPFEKAVAGIKEYLAKQDTQVEYDVYALNGDANKAKLFVAQTKKSKPQLIIALGSLALDEAAREITDIPIVTGMVLRKEQLEAHPNVSGVLLEIPIEQQLQWIQKLVPRAKNIGVLYNPDENGDLVKSAAKVALKMGLTLNAQEVASPKNIPQALKNITNSVDVLWGISDKTVLTPQTAKDILLFSFRNRIPFVGLSASWVKAGAYYALDRDYNDIGLQCGEMAYRILKGSGIQSLHPVSPRKIVYSLNMKTAGQIKIDVPEALAQGAVTVF
jgi:putative ABC transport system substrate-binding protein